MKIRALVFLALCIHSLGFAQAVRPLTHLKRLVPPEPRDGEGTGTTVCPILIYHSIRRYVESDTPAVRRYIATPEALEQELAWLRDNGFVSVSFDDLANHITSGAPLPPKPVILSFDDDWESQYRYGLPLLKKYGFSATFYIWVVVVGMKHHMTWDEIRELKAAGMQLGCHTITHPYLTRVQKDETLQHEILGARKIIEARTGASVTTIAYPFGQYDERVVAAAKSAGFTSARSTWPGVVHSQEGLYSLTGLIRTESEKSLVDSIQKYLALSESTDGVAGAAGASGVAGAGGSTGAAGTVAPASAATPAAGAGPALAEPDQDPALEPLKPQSAVQPPSAQQQLLPTAR
ncbi:MAG: polysaccharide deacetylase family protein [Spirochaetia bacterium]|jgi:peptidoglycan/xylan/chitin deacetylase (PgdA/CDA1 family)